MCGRTLFGCTVLHNYVHLPSCSEDRLHCATFRVYYVFLGNLPLDNISVSTTIGHLGGKHSALYIKKQIFCSKSVLIHSIPHVVKLFIKCVLILFLYRLG